MLSDHDVAQNIAANLSRLLEDRGWSQLELCRRTGEQSGTISRISNGKQLASGAILARIAEAFDVSVDRLVQAPPEKLPENLVSSRESA